MKKNIFLENQLMTNNKREKGERILHFDLLKILAAFLTVLYHFSFYKLDYGFREGTIYYPNFNRIIMCFASCCVPLFFIINGALMFGKERDLKSVYIKATKILILTVIWSFVGFPSWFFKTLIVLYLLFPIFQYCWLKKRILYYSICGIIFVIPFLLNLCILFLNCFGIGGLHTTGIFTMYSILYFLIGPILKETKQSFKMSIIISIIGWIMVVGECVIYTNLNDIMYDGVNAAFPTVGALLLSVGVFWSIKNIKWDKVKQPLIWFGESILSIYLMHMVMINIIMKVFGVFEVNIFEAILGSAIICLSCAVVGKLLERLPIVCWFVRM